MRLFPRSLALAWLALAPLAAPPPAGAQQPDAPEQQAPAADTTSAVGAGEQPEEEAEAPERQIDAPARAAAAPTEAPEADVEPAGGEAAPEAGPEAGAEGPAADEAHEAGAPEVEDDAALLRRRIGLARTHRWLGIATWSAMTATVLLGAVQFYNQYGFFSAMEDTPCVQGKAIFGQGQCSGTPWLHLGASLLTTGLYVTTGTLAWLMPVPEGYGEGEGRHARKLRLHRLLRWVHLGGMVAQMLLGYVIANGERFTLDRANDYGTLQALSATHLGIGLVTWGAMTWAGLLFL